MKILINFHGEKCNIYQHEHHEQDDHNSPSAENFVLNCPNFCIIFVLNCPKMLLKYVLKS